MCKPANNMEQIFLLAILLPNAFNANPRDKTKSHCKDKSKRKDKECEATPKPSTSTKKTTLRSSRTTSKSATTSKVSFTLKPSTTATKNTVSSSRTGSYAATTFKASSSLKPSTTATKTTVNSSRTGSYAATTSKASSSLKHSTTATKTAVNSSRTASNRDASGSVIAVAVSVPILIAIVTAAIIAFLLWRRRREKSNQAAGSFSGTSFKNRNYEESHGLDRHLYLVNTRASVSCDGEYAEIALQNLQPGETDGNVYQTIDSLPEDHVESNGGYGHLKTQTTKLIDMSYSHFPMNQTNGHVLTDLTYAHTGGDTSEQDLKGNKAELDSDTTYNRLDTMPNTNQGKIAPEQEEGIDDVESEYNHAQAGLPDLASENKADTYSHLNDNLQKPPALPTNGLKSGKDGNIITNYAECMKKEEDCEGSQGTGPNGYEAAVGSGNNYFILEPENGTSGNGASFHVVVEKSKEETCNSESEETPYHQYFTLEKTVT